MQLDCGRLGDAAQPNADSSNTSRGGRRPSVTVSLCLGAWSASAQLQGRGPVMSTDASLGAWSASAQLQGRGLGPSTDASLGAWREVVPLQGRGPTTAAANCLEAWSASVQLFIEFVPGVELLRKMHITNPHPINLHISPRDSPSGALGPWIWQLRWML